MKKVLLLTTVGCMSLVVVTHGQQEFKVNYIFNHKKFLAANLHMVTAQPNTDVIDGYVLQPDGAKYPIHRIIAPKISVQKQILNKLKGVIDFRTGDVLYIHFWNIVNGPNLNTIYVTPADNGNDFTYQINWNRKGNFSIPFSYRILTATAIPFRYNFVEKTTTAEFLNFNLAYFFVGGKTKLFRNEDIKPRSFYLGIGPYIGVTGIEDLAQVSKQFGITYGASTVFSLYGLNVIESFGFENGFTPQTSKSHFYIGFGIGYNLVSLFNPSN